MGSPGQAALFSSSVPDLQPIVIRAPPGSIPGIRLWRHSPALNWGQPPNTLASGPA